MSKQSIMKCRFGWAAKGVVQHVGVMYFFIIPSVVILILWYSYTIKRLDIPKFKNYNEM